MRLSKIRLAGFKSFVDPTNIPFPGDMTAVVGPNGCGKSNVIDAVRWVLGESSAKNLRGDAMTDVIFNGSSARKAVSQCSVELVFDNSSGRISGEFANYSELSVKRTVTKDAISSYQLNGSKCRRRDITDLFLGTGLGPRSYAIIEQGMISKLIESKPQDLRVFIEEAAGISKYKERRKETLNRIGHTKDNLVRLEDVRQALGEQLAKLKRQATAANRYKALKAHERELKGQLTTLRWLAQSELVKRSDDTIAAFQQTLEGLVTSKQLDESGLQSLKNDQSVSKRALSDVQQQIYQLGNDITKLEQSQLFARKRNSQIQAELQQIEQQNQQTQIELASIDEEIDACENNILQSAPEAGLLQEQLEELQGRLEDCQSRQNDIQAAHKHIEDDYYQHKQIVQQKHGQLQQTLSLQQRTQSRIAELAQELLECEANDHDLIANLQAKLNEGEQQLAQYQHTQQQATDSLAQKATRLEQFVAQFKTLDTACIELHAQIAALTQLQSSATDNLPDYLLERAHQPYWQAFHAQPGYEKALETAMSLYKDAIVVATLDSSQIPQDQKHAAQPLLLSDQFTETKRKQSMAHFVEETQVPHFFNHVWIAEDYRHVQSLLVSLGESDIVVTLAGEIYSKDVFVSYEQQPDGKIERSARIARLQQAFNEQDAQRGHLSQALANMQAQVESAQQHKTHTEVKCNAQQHQLALLNRDIDNAKAYAAQQQARIRRVRLEHEKQTETLIQEQTSSELLIDEIEDTSTALAEIDAQRRDVESQKQAVLINLQAIQAQRQQAQLRLHEHALHKQGLQNSYQIFKEQRKNKFTQLQDNQEKLRLLTEEAESLLLPTDEQQLKLHQMLEHKQTLESTLRIKQHQVNDIDENIVVLEKGQAGINQKIDSFKQRIETERLSAQTAKVKAQAFIEQLAEMNQNVRDVLDRLPEDAQEKRYQHSLEEVSNSLSRLGAVNLAAADEYSEQAARKQHLDDQNTDLTQALDILQTAMRKIDKETRTRFKQTFDQVNSDLKILFPKVFGGGTAYLTLTDEDLLETGVTIMARPPGKKNSTIHLLSGGEKALTALSLVFAIFRLNPAPFCLLDEVDAPLDDANVGRFCKLVSEMSKTVQFIYITHNKIAMEMATHLTGVTMAEPGVSRMVTVDMDAALAIAE
jgi:chromosome segregation protein